MICPHCGKEHYINPGITKDEVLTAMVQVSGVPAEKILSLNRRGEIVAARYIMAYVMKKLSGLSLSKIAAELGYKDHTVLCHGMKKINAMVEYDMPYLSWLRTMEEIFELEPLVVERRKILQIA